MILSSTVVLGSQQNLIASTKFPYTPVPQTTNFLQYQYLTPGWQSIIIITFFGKELFLKRHSLMDSIWLTGRGGGVVLLPGPCDHDLR